MTEDVKGAETTAKAVQDPINALTAVRIPTLESAPSARCVLCYGLPGNPGDCTHGDRFAIEFGSHGGVVLCEKALGHLFGLTHRHLNPDKSAGIAEVEFSNSQPVGEG